MHNYERPQQMTIENALGSLNPASPGQGSRIALDKQGNSNAPITASAPNRIEVTGLVNQIPYLNEFLLQKHEELDAEGELELICITLDNRRQAMKSRFPLIWIIGWMHLFFWHRLLPKIKPTRSIYRRIFGHRQLVISKAEILGRLVYCGYEIGSVNNDGHQHKITARKTDKNYLHTKPSYGAIYKMPRVGKHGKTVMVYKIRTMHPYSEYLQDYLIKHHGYSNDGKGKIANDFRVLSYGSYMRKIWLDELPQLINVLKGEMSLVGARPLSQARFNQFPEDLKHLRTQFKPGCFPPYVALLMGDEKSNIEAERIYFEEKQKSPHLTDIKYLLLAIKNIALNKIRSA